MRTAQNWDSMTSLHDFPAELAIELALNTAAFRQAQAVADSRKAKPIKSQPEIPNEATK
jgi:hypothetical protein